MQHKTNPNISSTEESFKSVERYGGKYREK